MKKTRIVQIVANRNKYTKFPFMAVPRWNSQLNTYETGQHIIPGVTSLDDGLTVDEMTGAKPLSEEKARKFPYVINPDDQQPLVHLVKLNLSTDEQGKYIHYKDYALYNFFVNHTDAVAKSKDEYIVDKHLFYVQDNEVEAEKRITKRKLIFKAQAKVQENVSINRLQDLALLISYNAVGYSINPNATMNQLEDSIMEACEKYPEEVLNCFEMGAQDQLFILKLVNKQIIDHRDTGYFDGAVFLGNTVIDVIDFARRPNNEYLLNRWTKLLSPEQTNIPW